MGYPPDDRRGRLLRQLLPARINFRDEGGTLTLLGQRVMNGEVPFREVELGYNVGWFLPIAGLFKVIGVDFVGLRVFFFVLSTLAAVLGFLTVGAGGPAFGSARVGAAARRFSRDCC
jgi:hypothetical protein